MKKNKAEAARENGKKGGRPLKSFTKKTFWVSGQDMFFAFKMGKTEGITLHIKNKKETDDDVRVELLVEHPEPL